MISKSQCTKILIDKYRYNKSLTEISKNLEIDRKTAKAYITFASTFIQDSRFDLNNDRLFEKLSAYIIELKSCRTYIRSTPKAIEDLRQLYTSISDSKNRTPGKIYDIIQNSDRYNGTDLSNMSYSAVYRALQKIKSEFTNS